MPVSRRRIRGTASLRDREARIAHRHHLRIEAERHAIQKARAEGSYMAMLRSKAGTISWFEYLEVHYTLYPTMQPRRNGGKY